MIMALYWYHKSVASDSPETSNYIVKVVCLSSKESPLPKMPGHPSASTHTATPLYDRSMQFPNLEFLNDPQMQHRNEGLEREQHQAWV